MDSIKRYTVWDYDQGGYITLINNKRYIGSNIHDGVQFDTYNQAVAYIKKIDKRGYDKDRYYITPCIKD